LNSSQLSSLLMNSDATHRTVPRRIAGELLPVGDVPVVHLEFGAGSPGTCRGASRV
jgi:hypothetical protein